jgi:hypothetical protein
MFRRNRNRAADVRAREARTLAGVIAAGLLLGGTASTVLRTAGEWFQPEVAGAQANTTATAVARAREAARPAGGASAPSSVSPTAPSSSGATASSTPPKRSKTAAARSTVPSAARPAAPAKTATAGAVVQSPAHLDDQVAYQYNALGRRDPFQSLLSGEYVGSDVGGGAPPDVGGLKVVGIVWGDADQFALVEDARGDSHILRRGDKVMNGYVEALKRDAMIVNLTLDGQSQSVRVPLTRKGDKANANR